MARRSTRRGMKRRTRSTRRAYEPLPSSKKKIEKLERSNKALRGRLSRARSGNPFPHGPHLKTELEAFSMVAAGGAASGYLSSRIDAALAGAGIPPLPAGLRTEWALTALFFAAPAMGWVKGANGARMALASSGMAAAQLSDYFKTL